MQQKSK